ncbi:unnamed protein product [Pedinophyceae sp. YPF-701]|nr:unnamed protein product [Pedinophyceae sp. YPF-701]
MLQYFSAPGSDIRIPGIRLNRQVAENESVGRVAYNLQQRMLIPCGIPPERKDEA